MDEAKQIRRRIQRDKVLMDEAKSCRTLQDVIRNFVFNLITMQAIGRKWYNLMSIWRHYSDCKWTILAKSRNKETTWKVHMQSRERLEEVISERLLDLAYILQLMNKKLSIRTWEESSINPKVEPELLSWWWCHLLTWKRVTGEDIYCVKHGLYLIDPL